VGEFGIGLWVRFVVVWKCKEEIVYFGVVVEYE